MKKISAAQLSKLQDCDQLLKSSLYTFDNKINKFTQMQFTLYPNMLIGDNQEYLVLSSCIMNKKIIQYKEFTAQGVQLLNSQGNLFLFYESYVQQLNWEKQLKRFSKLQNFSNKYTIQEKLSIQNHYACVKNKNNRVYTVQLIRLSSLSEQLYEALMNEINILMCFKQNGLHQFHALFEDGDILYILYDYWVGDTLYKLLQQGFKLTASQIAQIIFQIIKVVRFLHQNNLYHGAILPTNIVLHRATGPQNQSGQQLKITLFNFAYRDANQYNLTWLNKRVPKQWIPPEFNNLQIKPEFQNIDGYQIGVLLYYLTFHTNVNKSQQSFIKSLDNFKVDYQWLKSIKQEQQQEYSFSLIELLCGLLDPDFQNRITLNNALAHQWLTNQRQKQNGQNEKPKILPSLRTILELREQSSCEILSSRLGKEDQLHVTSSSEDDIEVCDDEYIHRISKENNKIPYYQNILSLIPQKHPSRNKQIIDQCQESQF